MEREILIRKSELRQIWDLETDGCPPIEAVYVVSDDEHEPSFLESWLRTSPETQGRLIELQR
jgi:hypothetical protein